MNILFINHGDFACNSMNHIAAFANELSRRGHGCVVASPHSLSTAAALDHPLFLPRLFSDVLAKPGLFPNGKPADVIHAWTPREIVRTFVCAYLAQAATTTATLPCLLVHLEDNEEYLAEQALAVPFTELREKPQRELAALIPPELSHPRRYRTFLRMADGITGITERLEDFAPPSAGPSRFQLLTPGVDFRRFTPDTNPTALRQTLALKPTEKILAYTGNSHFGNTVEVRNLHLAVQILNDRGTPCRLLRTGSKSQEFVDAFAPAAAPYVVNLGVVEAAALPEVLALADVLVQPGADDAFNRYRLPSKIPEFLSMGKPVVLPRSNLAAHLTEGRDALFLDTGSPEEIAGKCQSLFADPDLAGRLGQAGLAFAREHFDIVRNTDVLEAFYQRVMTQPQNLARQAVKTDPELGEIALLTALLRDRLSWAPAADNTDPPSPGIAIPGPTPPSTACHKHLDAAALAAELQELLAHIALEGAELAPTQRDLAATREQLAHTQADLQTTSNTLQSTRLDLQNHQALLQQANAQLERTRADLAQAFAELDAARKSLHDMTAQHQAELAWRQSMQNSSSWKITRPLRWLGQTVHPEK